MSLKKTKNMLTQLAWVSLGSCLNVSLSPVMKTITYSDVFRSYVCMFAQDHKSGSVSMIPVSNRAGLTSAWKGNLMRVVSCQSQGLTKMIFLLFLHEFAQRWYFFNLLMLIAANCLNCPQHPDCHRAGAMILYKRRKSKVSI